MSQTLPAASDNTCCQLPNYRPQLTSTEPLACQSAPAVVGVVVEVVEVVEVPHCRIDLYGIKARLRRLAGCGRRWRAVLTGKEYSGKIKRCIDPRSPAACPARSWSDSVSTNFRSCRIEDVPSDRTTRASSLLREKLAVLTAAPASALLGNDSQAGGQRHVRARSYWAGS